MAIIQPTFLRTEGDDSVIVLTWANLANGDSGAAVQLVKYADRSVQITGTFGTGGTAVVEGSNDNSNFVTLNSTTGAALSFTTGSIRQILENTTSLRPRVTAGDATTSLTVTALIRTGTAIVRK